jgi:hypothetical protein
MGLDKKGMANKPLKNPNNGQKSVKRSSQD